MSASPSPWDVEAMKDVLLLSGALALAACSPPARFTDADEAAIREVITTQQEAWNAGKLEAFMSSGYVRGERLVFTSGGRVQRGYDATLARYQARYSDPAAMGKLTFSDLEVTGLGPRSAYVLGRWGLSETPNAAGGVFTLVFVKEAEGWRILHDHTSADPKPAPGTSD